ATVSLSSNNSAVASVPSSVTIPAGATSATFTATTNAVASSTTVIISAEIGRASCRETALTVLPPVLASLGLSATSVTGATPVTGTATLNRPAPSGGAIVSLSSGNSAVASVPSGVTIPAGATSATFRATTNAVASSTTVIISA